MTTDVEMCDVVTVHPERVAWVSKRLIDEESNLRLSELFDALSDSTRLRIIEVLSLKEMCVCDITAALNLSQSATSHQLRILRNLRLVRYRKSGRLVYYALDDEHILSLFSQGLDHIREGIK